MIYLFYRLALERRHSVIIRGEIDKIDSVFDAQALKGLDHLNGAINEVLRLHPSVPTGGYRESPPQGVEVAGRFIPGNTTIVSPRYTMGRRMCFFPFSLRKLLGIRTGLTLLSHRIQSINPSPVPPNSSLNVGILALNWLLTNALSHLSASGASHAWESTWHSRS